MRTPLLPLLLVLCVPAATAEPVVPALEFVHYVAPRLPPAFNQQVSDGYAVIAFTVSADGSVLDALALSASDRHFAAAMEQTVRQWRLLPSDAARPYREVIELVFRQGGVVRTLTHLDGARSAFPKVDAQALRTLRRDQLASPPRRLPATAAAAPHALRGLSSPQRVTVSYVIDEAGRVRVPLVIAADSAQAAEAALAVTSAWRYAPVMHSGTTVQVEDRQTLTFKAPAR